MNLFARRTSVCTRIVTVQYLYVARLRRILISRHHRLWGVSSAQVSSRPHLCLPSDKENERRSHSTGSYSTVAETRLCGVPSNYHMRPLFLLVSFFCLLSTVAAASNNNARSAASTTINPSSPSDITIPSPVAQHSPKEAIATTR